MKRMFIILAVLLFSSSLVNGQVRTYKDITGRWEIVGKDISGASLEIIDSTKIFLTYDGVKKQVSAPKLNTQKNPVWFDFDITDSTGTIHVKTLIQVYGNGVMKWQIFLDEERTDHFTASSGELMYLKKTKTEVVAVVTTQ